MNYDFIPIGLRDLPIGSTVDCEVYSKKVKEPDDPEPYENSYVLLFQNQTVTEELIARLKRKIFPETYVYISRRFVISCFFDRGILLGFSEEDAEAIRDGENPWDGVKLSAQDESEESEQSEQAEESVQPEQTEQPVKPEQSEWEEEDPPAHVKRGISPSDEPVSNPKLEKVIKNYDKSKVYTVELIDRAMESGTVDTSMSTSITTDVQTQVNNTEPALIIQAINRIRTDDEYLYTHSLNVAYLNGLMGKWLKWDDTRQNELVEIGLLHDLGKLKIDPKILNKPARLTPEEFEEIKKHSSMSLEMLVKSGITSDKVLDGVLHHHEKLNGTGYPDRLKADEISDYARITSISDIYDAMVTKRVYKDPQSPFSILNEFIKGGYSELDLTYVEIFVNCIADELKGKEIILSDGRTASILLVNPRKPLNSIVNVDGEVTTLGDKIYCIRMA